MHAMKQYIALDPIISIVNYIVVSSTGTVSISVLERLLRILIRLSHVQETGEDQ